ncbi:MULTISPECIES: ABC transporter ATP-binding protein [Terribacillus]|uniref:ABC transporter ATP-binding protein n=1 Tax=Terribacillus saccharophilus TaxID=361277 RepID=A0ABX4H289_9BACI|nr:MULTISPECIES: ABC transporter ATP-binding protein [Terribacillus]PAD36880.1 ABC transporter ATP-binding protein [Terribacillus saccharophilus]PAD97863.1 ABC transporter ATP-binding protein [Terribacillus saccharophilus]PAE01245.1 ABC transporter ATP-binding protein [Terribacillus saccharophilus]
MKTVFSYLKPYWLIIVTSLIFIMMELSVELVQPFLLQKLIDDGIAAGNNELVIELGLGMVAIAIVGFGAGIINIFFADHLGQSVGKELRDQMYEKVQKAELQDIQRFGTSTLLTRLTNDVNQIQLTLVMFFRFMIRAPFLIIGGTVMAFVVNARIALILLIVIPILLIFLRFIMKRSIRYFGTVQRSVDKVNHVMRENLVGLRLIRIFVREQHEQKRFEQTSNELRQNMLKAFRYTELSVPLLTLVMNIAILAILYIGGMQQQTNVGDIVAIVNYATRITGALSVVGMLITFYARAKASSTRIADILELDPPADDGETTSETFRGKIDLEQVTYRYPNGKVPVIEDFTLEIKSGERVAILGETGSGKSTLLHLMIGLYEPDKGQVLADDTPLPNLDSKSFRREVGFVSQDVQLFSGTIRENIAWGIPDASEEAIVRAAKDAQIYDTISKLPEKLDTRLGQNGINLSGGQKQRLTIARALLLKPSLLLLDDSTSALDLQTERKLLEALKRYECTTVLVTQKLSTAMQCDRILIVEEGKRTAYGTADELLEQSELFRAIQASQAQREATS